MQTREFLFIAAALVCAAALSAAATPVIRAVAKRIGALDIPTDDRRMHSKPVPLLGGVAIFLGFTVASMLFCDYNPAMYAMWFGGTVIVCCGILDDMYRLSPWLKLFIEVCAALIAVSQGLTISFVNAFGSYIVFGVFEIPVTVLWIVGMTNAINLIDGLDGLSCGVSLICSLSLMTVACLTGDPGSALLTAVIAGSCLGFLPYNLNPAKIFMGDTGALFLGYILSLISIGGLFKLHTLVSFVIPAAIFALPLSDAVISFFRRLFGGKSPFTADRKHLHHRLIDLGFGQKKTVLILYAVSAACGVAAIMLALGRYAAAALLITAAVAVFSFFVAAVRARKRR